MLKRKIESKIEEHLLSKDKRILIIEGARQVGKTYIIRQVGQRIFKNFIEINMLDDFNDQKRFEKTTSVDSFLFALSSMFGDKMDTKENTLIFIDEIQAYPHFLTMLKFLVDDDSYTYIASGSLLGVTLKKSVSIPIGYIHIERMYPLDFEEFIMANGYGELAINTIRNKYNKLESLDEVTHKTFLDIFKKYLLIGGLPAAVNAYLKTNNIVKVREIQKETHDMYGDDASQYDKENKLKIVKVYNTIPSNMENKKKRVVAKKIENNKWKKYDDYVDEFEYLINSGIALNVQAISNPIYPLNQSESKNLLKLYLNDVGILSEILYKNNIDAVLNDNSSINLGSVYETIVASELKAHGYDLYYYDNKNNGEVDYIINDYNNLTVLPIEVKSGKDYLIHSALNKLMDNNDYHKKKSIVLSNHREVTIKNNIIYMPIYYVMFI